MITLYDKDDLNGTTPLAELTEFISCSLSQEWNRRYEIEFTYPARSAEGFSSLLAEYQLLNVDGQWYRIHRIERMGGGNYHTSRDHTINVLARHIFYDLAFDVIDDEIYDESEEELPPFADPEPVSCGQALAYVLGGLNIPGAFSASSNIMEERLMPNLSRKNGVDAIMAIVDEWDGVLVRDNRAISVNMPTTPASTATIEFQDNMQSIQEVRHSDDLVGRIYPVGANHLRLPERFLTTSIPGTPNLPFAKHITFNNARTEDDLRQYALDYLDRYGSRDAYYQVQCILLQEEAKAKGLATPEDILYVNVGDTVTIRHSEFNIDVERRVISIQRDLMRKYNNRIEVGQYLHGLPEYLTDFEEKTEGDIRELYQQKSTAAWAEEVMKFVHEILGGTIKDIHPELLLYTPSNGLGNERRKALSSAISTVQDMGPGFIPIPHTDKIYMDDPLVSMGRRNVNTVRQAFRIIHHYIIDTTHAGIMTSPLTTLLNTAYADHYGEGQIVSEPELSVGSVFGDTWPMGSEEYRYARRIVDLVRSRLGNTSEIYLEMGGGNGGVIGALNNLYYKVSNPDFTPIYWAEVVMAYVRSVLGGSAREVDAGLLLYSPRSLVENKSRVTLMSSIAALDAISPDGGGTEYSSSFVVEDALANIKQRLYLTIPVAFDYIESFIRTTTGNPTGANLVDRLNSEYASVYGVGQMGSLPPDTVESAFGEDWAPGSTEYVYAEMVIQLLASQVGNTSEIYLEIGGGRTGLIGSLNRLYDKLSEHGITVSPLNPDNSVGKNGDLWFKFEEEEEE